MSFGCATVKYVLYISFLWNSVYYILYRHSMLFFSLSCWLVFSRTMMQSVIKARSAGALNPDVFLATITNSSLVCVYGRKPPTFHLCFVFENMGSAVFFAVRRIFSAIHIVLFVSGYSSFQIDPAYSSFVYYTLSFFHLIYYTMFFFLGDKPYYWSHSLRSIALWMAVD